VQLQAYRINEALRLEPVSADSVDLQDPGDNGPLWLDVAAAQEADITELLAPLGLHPVAMEGCVKPADRARVETFDNAIFFSSPYSIDAASEIAYVRGVCLPEVLVTIREQPAARFHEKLRRKATAMHARNVAAMIFHIIDVRGDELLQDALQLPNEVNRLSRQVEDDGDAVDGSDIQSLKRRVGTFAVMFEDLHATVAVFRQLRSGVVRLGELMEYYRDLEGALNQLARKMERLDGQLQDTRQLHHAALQQKTNRHLNVLTIVQSVFVPLTLITGIYGMNFVNMPELQRPNAYFWSLGVMSVIAAGALLLFYRKGWLS